LKYRHLVILALCSGCFPDRATVDPYAYAPKSSGTVWKLHTKNNEPPAVPDENTPLSFAEALDIALKNNPTTKLTWAQARVAAAQYGQSESYLFPTLNGTYTYTRQRNIGSSSTSSDSSVVVTSGAASSAASTGAQPFYLSQWGPQLQLSYLLFDFGQHRATSDAARESLYYADYTHNRQIQTIIQLVASNYYNLLYQKELLKANEADLYTAQITYDAAKLELDTGTQDLSDFLQAQTKLLQAQVALVTQKQNVINATASLLTNMGVKANQKIELQEVPEIPPTDEMLQSAEEVLAIAMQKRADLLAAQSKLKSQEATVVAAQRQFLPQINYTLDFGQTSYTKIGSDNFDFTSTFTLSWPIFTGFSNLNNLRQAKALKEEAAATLLQTQLQVIEDITTSYSNVKTTFESLRFTQELLATTEKQYDVSLERYKAGTGTIIELTTAQSNLADARASLASSTNQWFTALIELSYAAGTLEPPLQREVQ
jgi:outer membrane protein TolC